MFKFKKLTFNKIEKLTEELFEVQNKKKEIEIQNIHLNETIKNLTSQKERELKDVEHQQKLKLQEAEAKFNREKNNWLEDKHRQEKMLKEDYDRKYEEAVTLLKLDSEQKIKQAELEYNRKLQKLEQKQQNEIQELKNQNAIEKMDLHEEYYEKLKNALIELHSKGNTTTQFVQELALKMLERPLGATVTENRLLLKTDDE